MANALIKAMGIVAATAVVLAGGVNAYLAYVVLPVPEGEAIAPVAPDAPSEAEAGGAGEPQVAAVERRTEADYLRDILGRNIFDHENVGFTVSQGAPGEEGVVITDLNATLHGTIVAEPESFSAAWVSIEGGQSNYPYGIGQKILDAEIIAIEKDRIQLRRGDGREESLVAGGEAPKSTKTQSTASTDGGDGDVQKVSDTEFVVSREMLDAQLADMGSLSKMGRALLHRGPDGEYDGYRLSAIRRGTLADKLGIRNGDVIHSVNGMELNSVQGAMQALQALQSEGSLKFEVTRRGQPVSLNYDIQ